MCLRVLHSIANYRYFDLPYCQSNAKLKYSPTECASMDAINSKYRPMQKSAKDRWHIRNFGTVMSALGKNKLSLRLAADHSLSHLLENSTTNTEMFPNTANSTTTHTDHRNQCEPIMSSHGFKASDLG